MKTLSLLIPLSAVAIGVLSIGCAAPGGDADADVAEESAASENELSSTTYVPPKTCGEAKWNAAFAKYKAAVDGANRRVRGFSCSNASGAYRSEIVANASLAASTCKDFSSIVKNSPYAKSLRTVLSESIDYEAITGSLSPATWSGLGPALAGGATFWDTDGGVYGNAAELTFEGPSKVTLHVTSEDRTSVGTYRLGARAADGSMPITVTIDGRAKVYRLMPDLSLKIDGRTFWSTPDECSA